MTSDKGVSATEHVIVILGVFLCIIAAVYGVKIGEIGATGVALATSGAILVTPPVFTYAARKSVNGASRTVTWLGTHGTALMRALVVCFLLFVVSIGLLACSDKSVWAQIVSSLVWLSVVVLWILHLLSTAIEFAGLKPRTSGDSVSAEGDKWLKVAAFGAALFLAGQFVQYLSYLTN